MRQPTLRIPLAQQPPVYLLGAVVIAAALPLLLQLFGIDLGGPPLTSAPVARGVPPAPTTPPPVVAAMPSHEPTAALADATAEPVADTAGAEPAAMDLDDTPTEDIIVFDLPEEGKPAVRRRAALEPAPKRANKPRHRRGRTTGPMARAKAACRDHDRRAARSAYRAVPRGDARRRAIRRACRERGVWIL